MDPASRAVTVVDVAASLSVALGFIAVVSAIPEPARRRSQAILVAGAGAAYLGAGLGAWEPLYVCVATAVAYRGLDSYRAIGVAWLMHVAWDIVHHLWAAPILPFIPTSSAQCALCDAVIAGWFLGGAWSPLDDRRATSSRR